MKITKEEILKNWGDYYIDRLVDILNKEYPLDEAIEDVKSFRKKPENANDKDFENEEWHDIHDETNEMIRNEELIQ